MATTRQALRALAGPGALDLNLVISTRSVDLDRSPGATLRGVSAGDAFRLLVQLAGVEVRRVGRRTLVLVDPGDRRQLGSVQAVTVRPLRTLPSRVVDELARSPPLAARLPPWKVTARDEDGSLFVVASPDQVELLRRLVRRLDAAGGALFARIPVSFLDEEGLRAALALRHEPLPDWTFQLRTRMVLARGDAASLERLQAAIRAADRAPGQVRLTLHLVEVSRQAARRLGVTLGSTALQVQRLDRLLSPSDRVGPASLELLLEDLGARSVATRWLTALDGETATATLGQVRNVRAGVSLATPTGTATATGTREVTLGLTLSMTPRVHADGTATLELDLADERPLAIRPDGVDRTSDALRTTVRARHGVPLVVSGFDQAASSASPQGSAAAERRRQETRRVLVAVASISKN